MIMCRNTQNRINTERKQIMSRLTGENIEQFRSGNGGEFKKIDYLSLKKDKEIAKIRLLYNGADDIEAYVVHRVKVRFNDREFDLPVNCLAENSIEDCPFCKAKLPKSARIYIPVFDEKDGTFKFWDRPNSFYSQLSGVCSRNPNTVSQVFEIERNGEEGSNRPGYQFYPIGQPDGTTIDDILDDCDFEEMPDPVGTKILDKTADEMEYYITHGEFPSERSDEDVPVRRRGSEDNTSRSERRTRGRGDRF